MTHYRLQVHCTVCDGLHLLPLAVTLQDAPAERKSIGEAYIGKQVPDLLAAVSGAPLKCPEKAKLFLPENGDIFLLPLNE